MEIEEKGNKIHGISQHEKYDKMPFRMDMQQIDWESILNPFKGDPAGMAATFQDVFESILNFHAPLRKKGTKRICSLAL